MKHLLILLLPAVILTGCKDKNVQQDNTPKTQEAMLSRKIPDLHTTDTCNAEGHRFVYTVDRISNDSLGYVIDEFGDKFSATTLTIGVTRDGSRMFSHTFTKASFKAYLTEEFLDNSIVDGCRFMKVEGGNVYFELAVSYPDSDMSQPFLLTIAPDGSYKLSKDDSLFEEDDSDNDGV
ncbi:MAG: DUF4738 domain-containing protein [Bacteroidaceae bacterium]|jgi:hypothetical protein|nr:DUF4738 domain-containing protein [Bacteroidaceae bacterium]MBQ2074213.1 DUF4738 domain-containing protein [Bacteroidaceae bacterium]